MSKYRDAAEVTARVGRLVEDATDVLIAFGVFSDPSSQRARLVRAVRDASAALVIMEATNWPTPADNALADGT